MKKIIILFILLFYSKSLFSQKLDENYILFSDTKEYSEYIIFKNDTILTRKPYHTSGGISFNLDYEKDTIYKDYQYKIENDSITILKFDKGNDLKFKIFNNQYFENSEKKDIYVLRSDFKTYPDIIVLCNDKIYWLDPGETSNGIITKRGKKNKKLSKIMKTKNLENTEIIIYKNYEAFKKCGYTCVFGVIEVKDKK